jgi:tetratricopeptide (TPR) repeat protein/predicted Ser/Thr protein kinase
MSSGPATFGRYQVVSQIGHGGMGALYLAWDPTLERKVAIKVLIQDNAELRERFSREARSAARLRHRHIVTMYDVGEYDGQPFMAMEYVEGETLADMIRKRKPLSTVRKLQLAEEIADGLAYAHKAGVIHRDVKPANVMVDLSGAAKILDFGIARLVESAGMTQAGTPIGTLNYMSPEQLAGRKVDQRSDIFSFGALVYELFSYRQAFPGGIDSGVLHRVLNSERDALGVVSPMLDPDIVRVVDRTLEADTAKRYQELDSVLKDLERIRLRLSAASTLATMAPGSEDDSITTLAFPTPTPVVEQAVSPTPRIQSARRPVDLEELTRRRAAQVQEYLKAAHEAFNAGDLDEGIAACERVMMLDAEEPTAIALLDRARAELDERQAEECLADAEREIRRGALTAALAKIEQAEALVPSSLKAAELRKLTIEALQERERARHRAEVIRQALARGHALFDQGRFEDAATAADEVLALDAGLSDAQSLKARSREAAEAEAREALARRAREAVREARQLFSANQHDSAVNLLARFEPKDEHVSLALEQLRTEAARIAEQRRLEAERRARQERVGAELLAARHDIDEQEFGRALDRLHLLVDAEGASPEIAGLLEIAAAGQAELERAEAVGREVAEHVARAAGLLARNDLTGASSRVDAALALDPSHAGAVNLRVKIQEGLKIAANRREAEQRRVRERAQAISAAVATAHKAESHEAAIVALDEALSIDPDHAEARRLLAHHREALGREQAEHHLRAEAEKTRREQIQQSVDGARRALHREDLDAARLAVARIRDLDPRHVEAAELAKEIELAELASAKDQRNFETVLTPLAAGVTAASSRDQTDRKTEGKSPAQERRVYAALGVGTAALALLAGLGYWVVGHRAPAVQAPASQRVGETLSASAPKTKDPLPVAVAAPPPVSPPTPSDAPAEDLSPDVEKRLVSLRKLERRQYARGQRQQALASATTALSLRPEDAEIKSFLAQALKDARAEAAAARSAALAVSAARPSTTYQDAEGRSQEARLAETGAPLEAVRSYWMATQLFVKAAAEAKNASPLVVAAASPPPSSLPPAPDVRPAPVREPPAVQPQQPLAAAPPPPAVTPTAPPAVTPAARPPIQTTVPPVVQPSPAPASPARASEEPAIRALIGSYAEAYSSLNVRDVQKVYPGVNAAALQKNFSQLKSQKVQIQGEQVQVNGAMATVTLTWQTVGVGQVGGALSASQKVELTLQKTGSAWIIVGRR